ncbi:MAG TPA: tRNA (adenosine(37)-N6)-threonylcarbamoyltransferase complex ATPase subunit type 1 TsaE [Burkholderiaceae bacterium]
MTQLQHPPILGTSSADWPDEAACARDAAALARLFRDDLALRSAFIELEGPLGAGKTTFVRHLLHALGVEGRIKSPTYAVVETYELEHLAISHFDFYRFDDPQEWEDAGLRDLFGAPGLKLVEWAEKAEPLLPVPDLRVTITPHDEAIRRVRYDAMTPTGLLLIENTGS